MIDYQNYVAALEDLQHQEIDVTLPALSAFMAISAMQLATRHPGFPASVLPHVVQVVQILACTIDPEPDGVLSEMVALGWDPKNDVTVRREP